MTTAIIIVTCLLVLTAYVFELTSSRTRIPTVITLLLVGWILNEITKSLNIPVPVFEPALPILGTVALIFIVFEGSLELEIKPEKLGFIRRAALSAFVPVLLLAIGLASIFHLVMGNNFKDSLINAIPLCVISSAIAIPTVRVFAKSDREFVTYESSLSDIIGVIFFNFVALNEIIDHVTVGVLLLQIGLITIISYLAAGLLGYLLKNIDHHVKFGPIILSVVLIYGVSKVYHLPGLLFIVIFGVFLGNLKALGRYWWITPANGDALKLEVGRLKGLVVEGAFLIRSLFFLQFGFSLESSEIFSAETFPWAAGITGAIFTLRAIVLRVLKVPLWPLLSVAPRGLITILLFLSIEPKNSIPIMNKSLIVQVIVLTAVVLMTGILTTGKQDKSVVQDIH